MDNVRFQGEEKYLKSNVSQKEVTRVPISLLGAGSYFGVEEVVSQQSHRQNLAICVSSELLLLVIHKHDYLGIVVQQ
jgi:hypothetical protein